MVRLAKAEDLPYILEIYATARGFMAENGNPTQWGSVYPPIDMLENDIRKDQLYVVLEDNVIHGVFMFFTDVEPTYAYIEEGNWISDAPYGTIHRVASSGKIKGIFSRCIEYCKGRCDHLRIDTHADNLVMQHLIEKHGFKKCGRVYMEDKSPRWAYEYIK